MPSIDSHASFEVVRGDVVAGLGEIFEADGERAFTVATAFRGEEVIGNERIFAVPWSYRCRHTGDFYGLFPTGRPLEIQGVTFVDHRGDGPLLHRYVDWGGVIAQLGLFVSWRIPVTEEEYQFGRERLGSSPP